MPLQVPLGMNLEHLAAVGIFHLQVPSPSARRKLSF